MAFMPRKFEKPAMLSSLDVADEDYLRAIGRVTVNWAQLEWTINWEIRSLFVHPSLAHRRTEPLRKEFKARASYWREAVVPIIPDQKKCQKLINIIDRSVQARNDRDWVIHGSIQAPPPAEAQEHLNLSIKVARVALVTYGERPLQWTIRDKPITAEWINRLANRISKIHADLTRFALLDLSPLLEEHVSKSK
jgi:hypothetical protein